MEKPKTQAALEVHIKEYKTYDWIFFLPSDPHNEAKIKL